MKTDLTFEAFNIFMLLYVVAMVALGIAVIVLGIKLVLKLMKLIDSQTLLNNERIKKLQSDH